MGIDFGAFNELSHSGKYALVFANCQEHAGRELIMQGDLKVKSSGSQPEFQVAMKAFAEHAVEEAHEYELEEKQKAMIHINSMMVSFVLLVVITISMVVRSKMAVIIMQ